MLNSARSRDVKAYLDTPRERCRRRCGRWSPSVAKRFCEISRDSNAAIKGVAVSDPQINGGSASVRVEYVYQDRNEVQMTYLEKTPGGWKVVHTSSPTARRYASRFPA